MSQALYTEHILPGHIAHLRKTQAQLRQDAFLMEDGDPSHGKRSTNNPVQALRDRSWIKSLTHPPQSPDLDPTEGMWNIMKEDIKRQPWSTASEFKSAIKRAWYRITRDQIRQRIYSMKDQCNQLVESSGKRIKGDLW